MITFPGWYHGTNWHSRGAIGFVHSMNYSYVISPPGSSGGAGGYGGGFGGGGAGGGSGGGGGGGF